MDTFDQKSLNQLVGHAETYVAQLQQAGLIRTDRPVPVMTYLMTALKVGVITAPDLVGQDHLPSMEQVAQALSDLIRRWLSPEQLPRETTVGKQFLAEWLSNVINIEEQLE